MQTPEQKKKEIMEEFDKEFTTNKINDVYTIPEVNIKSFITQIYRQAQTSERERCKKVVEGMRITDKKGIAEMIFGDGRKENIRMHTNMDVGYNQALTDILKALKGEV